MPGSTSAGYAVYAMLFHAAPSAAASPPAVVMLFRRQHDYVQHAARLPRYFLPISTCHTFHTWRQRRRRAARYASAQTRAPTFARRAALAMMAARRCWRVMQYIKSAQAAARCGVCYVFTTLTPLAAAATYHHRHAYARVDGIDYAAFRCCQHGQYVVITALPASPCQYARSIPTTRCRPTPPFDAAASTRNER